MIAPAYRKQVELLLAVLPFVAKENPSKHQALARALEKVLNRTGSE